MTTPKEPKKLRPAANARRFAARLFAVIVAAIAVPLIFGFRPALDERDATAVAAIGGAHIEQILGPADFAALQGEIGPDFGVTPEAAIVLPVGGALYVVSGVPAAKLRIAAVALAGSPPESFALDPKGTMLTVSDGFFGKLDENGAIVQGVPIPYKDARLVPSSHGGAVYLLGGINKDYRLYRFTERGTIEILFECAEPIVAAADNTKSAFPVAATDSAILRIKKGAPEVLLTMPWEAGAIRSLAVTEDGIVIFSTDTTVYALLGRNAVSIINDSGGTLRLHGGVLYVLDRKRKVLFSLSPASAQLFARYK